MIYFFIIIMLYNNILIFFKLATCLLLLALSTYLFTLKICIPLIDVFLTYQQLIYRVFTNLVYYYKYQTIYIANSLQVLLLGVIKYCITQKSFLNKTQVTHFNYFINPGVRFFSSNHGQKTLCNTTANYELTSQTFIKIKEIEQNITTLEIAPTRELSPFPPVEEIPERTYPYTYPLTLTEEFWENFFIEPWPFVYSILNNPWGVDQQGRISYTGPEVTKYYCRTEHLRRYGYRFFQSTEKLRVQQYCETSQIPQDAVDQVASDDISQKPSVHICRDGRYDSIWRYNGPGVVTPKTPWTPQELKELYSELAYATTIISCFLFYGYCLGYFFELLPGQNLSIAFESSNLFTGIIFLIVFLPIFFFLLCLISREYLLLVYGERIAIVTMIFITSLVYLLTFYFTVFKNVESMPLLDKLEPLWTEKFSWAWIELADFDIRFGFLLDYLSLVMLVVVCSISTLVHYYSLEYMQTDPNKLRFLSYLSLFTFFMLFLVMSDNYLQMFFGWEGVGVCSYLLINFWSTRISANKSALKALVINRIGDCFFLAGVICLFYQFHTVDFTKLYYISQIYRDKMMHYPSCTYRDYIVYGSFESHVLNLRNPWITSWAFHDPLSLVSDFYKYELDNIFNHGETLISDKLRLACFFLFVGAMAKSAQITLHTWLPDAMEGPTPVSALIHAATMVTAGVFLVIRSAFLFNWVPELLEFIIFIGSTTAVMGASIALVQFDLKKIIAYSTCSQLGLMVVACGLGVYNASLFHLTIHAFFKALLFLTAGSVIHALNNEQDIRRMGGLLHVLPYSFTAMLIGSLGLTGFPFFSGFYSKEFILEAAGSLPLNGATYAYFCGCLTVFLTSFYSTRALYFTFLRSSAQNRRVAINIMESGDRIRFVLGVLMLLTIVTGSWLKTFFLGDYFSFWNFLLTSEITYLQRSWRLLPLCCSLLGLYLGYSYCSQGWFFRVWLKLMQYYPNFFSHLTLFLQNKWYFDTIYNTFAMAIWRFSKVIVIDNIEKGWLEYLGPTGISSLASWFSRKIKIWHNGSLLRALNYMILAVIFIIFVCYSQQFPKI